MFKEPKPGSKKKGATGRTRSQACSNVTPKDQGNKFDTSIPSYDRQPGETDTEWEHFVIFRDLLSRSAREAGEIYARNHNLTAKPASAKGMAGRYSAKWQWRRRVEDWDRELDRERQKLAKKEIEKMYERHISMAMASQQVFFVEIKKLLNKVKRDAEGNPLLSVRDLVALGDMATKLETKSRGEPTEIVEDRQTQSTDNNRSILGDPEAMKRIADEIAKAKKRIESNDDEA